MPDSGRHVLITGSAGFLGEATLDRLTAEDPSLLAVCADTRSTAGPADETRRFVSVVRDVRQPMDDLLADYEVDTVIHLAFMLRPPRDLAEARSVNVEATERLLESCEKAGVKQFIYLSSATVYGAHSGNERPFTEQDPVNPVAGFSYSEHKVEAERLVLKFAESNPECDVAILRGCVVMAPGANNFITSSLGLRYLPVPAGANPEMQFLHIDDYSSAVHAAVTQRARGIYNIAGSGTISWREMIRIAGSTPIPAPAAVLKGVTDLSWKFGLQNRSPAAGLAFIRYPWLVSTERIETELGWKAEHSSRDAVESWSAAR